MLSEDCKSDMSVIIVGVQNLVRDNHGAEVRDQLWDDLWRGDPFHCSENHAGGSSFILIWKPTMLMAFSKQLPSLSLLVRCAPPSMRRSTTTSVRLCTRQSTRMLVPLHSTPSTRRNARPSEDVRDNDTDGSKPSLVNVADTTPLWRRSVRRRTRRRTRKPAPPSMTPSIAQSARLSTRRSTKRNANWSKHNSLN